MSSQTLTTRPPQKVYGSSVEILLPEHVTQDDYAFLGKQFEDSKVVMARRVLWNPEQDEWNAVTREVKIVAAYRCLPHSFYVHSIWAMGASDNTYDGEAISLLFYRLRKIATNLGYDGLDFQVMAEMAGLMAFLHMNCKAVPLAIFGFMPKMKGK